MVGLFKTARGGLTHLLVTVDKFTKWIETKPSKKLNGPTAVTFITDITTRYGVPHSIITDNGTNFAKGALARFCATQGIRLHLRLLPTRSQTARSSEQMDSSSPASSPDWSYH